MTQASTIERYCIGCNAERQVHIETGRCQTCGRSTAHSEALPLNGVSLAPTRPAASQADGRLVLEETPAVRRWVHQTQALAQHFQDRAAKSEGFAQRFQSEAQMLARAARAFTGLLAQIGIEAPPPKRTDHAAPKLKRKGLRLPPGQWSREHEHCVGCGTTERKHRGNGLCGKCYDARKGKAADAS